ncbi:nucleotidyltransferase family protein [Deltaproteobacteria bacterium PRO3]|nr:nucleotidyltransferase family protein [Deltaproteobacteria bacterium PRO3]
MTPKLEPKILRHRAEILNLAAKHGIKNLRVFGSFARGEAKEDSDLDLLVELEPERSLLDRIGFLQDVEDLLGRKVDVVNERALHWYIRDRVLNEAVPL